MPRQPRLLPPFLHDRDAICMTEVRTAWRRCGRHAGADVLSMRPHMHLGLGCGRDSESASNEPSAGGLTICLGYYGLRLMQPDWAGSAYSLQLSLTMKQQHIILSL